MAKQRRPPEGPTQDAEARRRHALVQSFHVQVEDGPDKGLAFASSSNKVVIGTHKSAQLALTDPTVSRFHCEIVVDERGIRIRDLGSRNGTLVDRVDVIDGRLHDRAILQVGDTRVRFALDTREVRVPVSQRERFGVLVGRSTEMQKVFAILERAAESDATVLIEGETGTGKEVAAESIHRESQRAQGPFIVIDCGAIPANLLESELFGHEKGAFTGAVAAREGAFAAASGGTIFLDEIGELPLDLQPKLLRVLEKRSIKRVGANRHEPVDVRVIAATNRNLGSEVNQGRFRSDLYYRLAVVTVTLPALRDRIEDLPLLVDHILGSLDAQGKPVGDALRTDEFLAELGRHNWMGNVRELRNYLERCVALRAPLAIEAGPSPADGAPDINQSLKAGREAVVAAFERRYMQEILRRHGDNVTEAARAAGVDRVQFYRLLWRHGMR